MSFIEVKQINKTFKVPVKEKGRFGTLKTFFNRKYKEVKAINNISFSIKKGEIVGYIGPNGAGKSTTIKVLSGILVPDSGSVIIDKKVPWKERKEYVGQIGVVFGQRSQLWWDIPAIDTFNLLKDIYKIPDDIFEKECEDIQFIEKTLSRLEDKFSVLLNKFEMDYSIINDEEFLKTFFLFMHTQSIRTKGFRNGLENIASQTKTWLEKINIKNVNYPIELEAKDIAKLNQIKELLSLSSVYKKALSFFDAYDIYIGVNNTDIDFIISDNPMSYFLVDFNDICFPVNSKLSIIMQDHRMDM